MQNFEISSLIDFVDLKFERYCSSSAADVPVKFESVIVFTNLKAVTICDILWLDALLDHIKMHPWGPSQYKDVILPV